MPSSASRPRTRLINVVRCSTYLKAWFGPHIVTADLGEVFSVAVADIKDMASQAGVSLNDEHLFDMFNIMVMRLSHFAHTKPELCKMLGIKKGWFS